MTHDEAGSPSGQGDLELEDTMDWFEDDKMLEKNEGRNNKCEGVQKVPELMVSQVQMMIHVIHVNHVFHVNHVNNVNHVIHAIHVKCVNHATRVFHVT